MEKRLPLFMLLAVAALFGYQMLNLWLFPPKPKLPKPDTEAVAQATGTNIGAQGTGTVAANEATGTRAVSQGSAAVVAATPAEAPDAAAAATAEPDPKLPEQFIPLGTAEESQAERMLVTITTRGAAVVRVELNNPRFRDQEDPTGYLGHLLPIDAPGGARVQVVGPGTPTALAGVQVGDVITAVGGQSIAGARDFIDQVRQHRPRETVELAVRRLGEKQDLKLPVTLGRRPLEVIRPEWETAPVDFLSSSHDPLSLLLSLVQVGAEKVKTDENELAGVGLHDVNWEITNRGPEHVELTRKLPKRKLTVIKRYTLAKAPPDDVENTVYPAYHLMLDVEVHRDDETPIDVAYRLDGPNGLPTEGWWYLNKISRTWGLAGMRDVATHVEGEGPLLVTCSKIVEQAKAGTTTSWSSSPLAYVGVDSPYFSAILIPQRPEGEKWHSLIDTRQVGSLPTKEGKPDPSNARHNVILTNVSCRLTSNVASIARGKPLKHQYQLFAGPKRRNLVVQYGPPEAVNKINLKELIYYGWPIWAGFASLLAQVLHFFYSFLHNYALAIVMLTVVVKLCLYPLSRKQAISAQRMQELQPEMKRIAEKYKDDQEKRLRATQEFYRKNNVNPLSGCLPMLIQLPIFIGLYKALAIDIELRQAPLISETFAWCRNLAAPDMLWFWEPYLPAFLTRPGDTLFLGIRTLGPYLNILPLATVALFLWQQKLFMPKALDENQAMQQKIMKYMMVVMCLMFFTVPAGLCIYFIASSLWGIAERKLLPPSQGSAVGAATNGPSPAAAPVATVNNGKAAAIARRKKRRAREK